jgi:VWFA-related protein
MSIACMLLAALPAAAQAPPLKIRFEQITIDPATVYGGIAADFPDPVLSVLTIKDSHNRYVHGLADTSRWLSASDAAQTGQPVSDIWKTMLEYHADDPARPKNPDVKITQPGFQVREMRLNMGLSMAMVMDVSGSMIGRFDSVDNAGKEFIRTMHSNDRVAIFKFAKQCFLLQDFTNDTTKLIKAVEIDTSDWAGTYFYDALWTALTATEKEPERRIVIAFTDGRDHLKGHTINQVVEKAQRDSIPIYVIGVSNNNPNGGGPQLEKLQYIAESTGGLSYYAPSLDSLASIYKAIYGHISGYYVLAHSSPDPFTNGKKRVLDLTMDYLEEIGSSKVHHTGRDTIHYKVPYIPPNVFPRLTVTTDSMTAGPNPERLAMAGDTVVIGLTVRNNGRGHAAETRIACSPGDSLTAIRFSTEPDTVQGDSIRWFIPRIASGDSVRFTVTARLRSKMPRGDTQITAGVRVTSLDDSLAGDNTASAVFYGMGRPDLIPRILPVADTLSPGKPYRFRATVRNEGNSDLLDPFDVGLFIGESAVPVMTKSVPSLRLQKSATVEFETSIAVTGRYRVRVAADPADAIPELNAGVHSDEIQVIVGGPDFSVRVLPVPGTVSPGYQVRFRAVIRNRGNADCILPSQAGLFRPGAGSADATAAVPPLAMRDSVVVEFTDVFPLRGRYMMRVKADAPDQIPELDEDNNSDSTEVAVGIDGISVRVGGFSVSDASAGVQARFSERVFAEVSVMDRNSHPVRGLSDTAGWLGPNDPAPVGGTVGDAWATLSEVHEENTGYPPSSDVKTGMQVLQAEKAGVTVAFVLDYSAAAASPGGRVHSDLGAMIRGFSGGDRASVTGFSEAVTPLQALTSDTSAIRASLNRAYSGQDRKFYDALTAGIETVRHASGRNTVFAVTAGADAGSSAGRDDVIRLAQEAGVPLHLIGVGAAGESADLEILARSTGGWAVRAETDSAITPAVSFTDEALRDYYLLAFASSDTTEDSSRRLLRAGLRVYESSGADTGVYRAPLGRANLAVRTYAKGSSFTVSGGDTTWFVRTGEAVRYSSSVLNIGHQALSGIRLTDVLPHSFIPESIPFDHQIRGDSLIWNLDSLPLRGVVQYSYSYIADTLFSLQNLAFSNRLASDCAADTVAYDNRASDAVTYIPLKPPDIVTYVAGRGDSLVTVSGDSVWFTFAGSTVHYTITLTNIGELGCGGISVVNVLPPELTLTDFSGPAHTQRGDTLFWSVDTLPSRGGIRFAAYSCKVDTFLPPWQVPLVNRAWAHSDREQIPENNTAADTLYIAPLIPPDPQVRVEPALVQPGDSVRVAILTPVFIKSYDIVVVYETGETVTNYADDFIQRNPDLGQGEWMQVDPAFLDTRMRTNNTQERVGVVIVTTDLWDVTRSDTAYFTIRSADAFFLDQNLFRPAAGERLGIRFMLSSNRKVDISIFDIAGAFVKRIENGSFPAGWNVSGWDGKDSRGNSLGSGVYLAMLRSGEFNKALKFILVQ